MGIFYLIHKFSASSLASYINQKGSLISRLHYLNLTSKMFIANDINTSKDIPAMEIDHELCSTVELASCLCHHKFEVSCDLSCYGNSYYFITAMLLIMTCLVSGNCTVFL